MFAGSDKNSGGDIYFSAVGGGQADADYERLNQQILLICPQLLGHWFSSLTPTSRSV